MNEWVKELPVGTVLLCRTDRDIAVIKFGTAQGYGQNLWKTTEGKIVTDFIVQQNNPERLWRDSEVSDDRYEEGFDDGYSARRYDEL